MTGRRTLLARVLLTEVPRGHRRFGRAADGHKAEARFASFPTRRIRQRGPAGRLSRRRRQRQSGRIPRSPAKLPLFRPSLPWRFPRVCSPATAFRRNAYSLSRRFGNRADAPARSVSNAQYWGIEDEKIGTRPDRDRGFHRTGSRSRYGAKARCGLPRCYAPS